MSASCAVVGRIGTLEGNFVWLEKSGLGSFDGQMQLWKQSSSGDFLVGSSGIDDLPADSSGFSDFQAASFFMDSLGKFLESFELEILQLTD